MNPGRTHCGVPRLSVQTPNAVRSKTSLRDKRITASCSHGMSEDELFDRRTRLVEHAIDDYGSYLLNYLSGLTKQAQDAEELFDDLWIFVLNRFDESEISQLGLLRRKAYQLFVDYWRKKQRNPVIAVEDVPEIAMPSHTYSEPFTDAEDAAFKEKFFAEHGTKLPSDQQDALWWHARYGMTFQEIGIEMGKAPSTIGDWIDRARLSIAEGLNRN